MKVSADEALKQELNAIYGNWRQVVDEQHRKYTLFGASAKGRVGVRLVSGNLIGIRVEKVSGQLWEGVYLGDGWTFPAKDVCFRLMPNDDRACEVLTRLYVFLESSGLILLDPEAPSWVVEKLVNCLAEKVKL